jgi:HlyD family secretion protein
MQIKTLLIVFVFLSCSDTGSTTTPKRGNITESVYATGIIKAEKQYTVFSPVSGILQKINVTAGQDVTADQNLFEIENEKERLSVQNSLLSYRMSIQSSEYIQDKIKEMELQVQAAAERSKSDCSIYERNKRAQKYGGVTDAELDRTSSSCESSKLQLEASQKQLSQLKQQLKNERERNNINLQIERKTQQDYNIQSAVSGTVYDVLVHEGTLITPQTALAILGEKDEFLIELQADENDMASIVIGQRVLVSMDSYKNQVFEAKTDKIYPIMDDHSRTFKIEAHFLNPPKRLFPNLSVEANIIIRTKKNTIIIPKEYLFRNDYVLVLKDQKRKIKKGISDYQNVEIIAGLEGDEILYKPK